MKVGTRRRIRILDRLAQLCVRAIFVGLAAYGLALYMQNEWMMVK